MDSEVFTNRQGINVTYFTCYLFFYLYYQHKKMFLTFETDLGSTWYSHSAVRNRVRQKRFKNSLAATLKI